MKRGLFWLGMFLVFAAVVLSGGLQPPWLGKLFINAGGWTLILYPLWPWFRRGRSGRWGA